MIVSDNRLFADSVAALLANRDELRVIGSAAPTGEPLSAVPPPAAPDGGPAAAGAAGAYGAIGAIGAIGAFGAIGARADVVLVDAALDRETALARTAAVRERHTGSKLLVLGLDREDERVVDFIEAGALGYVLQSTSPADLVAAIRSVYDGNSRCSPRVAASVVARIASLEQQRGRGAPQEPEPLTRREVEVLAAVAAGLRNKEIGRQLRISTQTVKNHVHSILDKLGVGQRRQAVRLAYEHGLLRPPPSGRPG